MDARRELADPAVAALKRQASRLEQSQNLMVESWAMRNQVDSLQAEVARLREQLNAAGAAPPPSSSGFGAAPGGFNRCEETAQ